MASIPAMRRSVLVLAVACAPFVLAAQAAPATMVTCNDGTQSRSDSKSPCSGHGGVRGAVQVNAPPAQPSSGGGAVAVNAPSPGSPPAAPANVVHCMDGTTEPKSVGPVARLSPYCQGHGGVNDKPTQVGVSSHPTGAVAVTTPAIGTPASSTRSVHCKDGTTATVPKTTGGGVATGADPCKGHGGVSDHAVTVGEQPSTGGAVAVTAAPVGGSAGVHTQSSPNTIPCNDGTMQPRTATPCAGHGGPRDKPVQVGVAPGTPPPAPPSATTMQAATTMSHPAQTATALCKDGTYTMNPSPKDGCAGHGGVKTTYKKAP